MTNREFSSVILGNSLRCNLNKENFQVKSISRGDSLKTNWMSLKTKKYGVKYLEEVVSYFKYLFPIFQINALLNVTN